MSRSRAVVLVGTLAYLALIGWVTLGPQPLDESNNGPLLSILGFFARTPVTAWITYDLVEFLANVAMFVPLGVLLVVLLGRQWWWLAIAIGVATTCAIEFTQQYLPTRYPDLRDIAANSLGTLLGVSLVLLIARIAGIAGIGTVRGERPAVR